MDHAELLVKCRALHFADDACIGADHPPVPLDPPTLEEFDHFEGDQQGNWDEVHHNEEPSAERDADVFAKLGCIRHQIWQLALIHLVQDGEQNGGD